MKTRSTLRGFTATLLAVIGGLFATETLAQKVPQIKEITPGQYNYVVEMHNPALPIKIPPTTFSQCVSAKDLAEGRALQTQKDAGVNCTYSDITGSAGCYSFKSSCQIQGGMTMKGDYDVKASSNSVTMNIKQQMSGGNIPPQMANSTVKMTMTRAGDCAGK